MSDVNRFNGATIIVEDTSKQYHTYDDWGLYITNTDCIGEPEQYTRYVEVPGRQGKIDLTGVLSAAPVFLSRKIKINLAGTRYRTRWDGVISTFRNEVMGHKCKIIFDNDPDHYWYGRIGIIDFSSALNLGKFTIDIPDADPYKYSTSTSADPWLWDPFNFETGVITYIGGVTITGSGSITIHKGHMPTTPNIVVSALQSSTFTVTYGGKTYSLTVGSNLIPSIKVGGSSDVTLDFTGSATVQVVYRGGSL